MLPETFRLIVGLAATVAAVLVTAALGRLGRRPAHVASAITTTAILVVTVYLAEVLGRVIEIPRWVLVTHLTFANTATLAFLVVLATGARLFRLEEAARRRWHQRAVVAFLIATAAATTTGTWMLFQAAPRARSVLPALGSSGRAVPAR